MEEKYRGFVCPVCGGNSLSILRKCPDQGVLALRCNMFKCNFTQNFFEGSKPDVVYYSGPAHLDCMEGGDQA